MNDDLSCGDPILIPNSCPVVHPIYLFKFLPGFSRPYILLIEQSDTDTRAKFVCFDTMQILDAIYRLADPFHKPPKFILDNTYLFN
jgi:hypothetical protein